MSRSSTLALHRWLARVVASDVPAETAIGWLAGDAVRGVGTLVAIAPAGAIDDDGGAALAALARVIPWVVLVTVGAGAPSVPDAVDVYPWLGSDGFGALGPPMAAERVGARP